MSLRFMKSFLVLLIVSAFVVKGEPVHAELSATDKEAIILLATADDGGVNDPLERVNRAIFGFNEVINENLLGPVANAYNRNVPQTIRTGVSNFLTNLSSPISIANSFLQGDVMAALDLLARLVVNSTIGIGGIADVVRVVSLHIT